MTAPISILASGLPRVGARDAAATRSILAGLGAAPARVETSIAGLGQVSISVVGPAAGGARAREGLSFGVGWGSGVGRLSVDGALARRLVARTLGVESDGGLAVRRMGLGERGLLAGLVAAILHELRVPHAVSVTAPPDDEVRALGLVALELAVDVAGATGIARLEVPPGWLDEAASSVASRVRLAGLTLEASLERARTFLAAGALEALEPGDAVVFDGEPAGLELPAWPARLVFGEHAAAADVEVDGRVTLRGELQRVAMVSATARVTATEETDMADSGTKERASQRTAVLAAAPVEVIAEVGRFVLRGDEVLGLAPGAVLTLGGARSTSVALRVGGELWAEGELVDVDGALGVRVTKAFRR